VSIYTNDPFQQAFLRGTGLSVPQGHRVLDEFLASDEAVERFADLLHYASGMAFPDIDLECYCRRIATTTGRHDGPIDPGWSSDGKYEPIVAETTPTMCEDIARRMLGAWHMDGRG
jgi:hypothetical protein